MAVEQDNPDMFRLVFWSVISVISTCITVLVVEGWYYRYRTDEAVKQEVHYAESRQRSLVTQQRGELEEPVDADRVRIQDAMKLTAESLGKN